MNILDLPEDIIVHLPLSYRFYELLRMTCKTLQKYPNWDILHNVQFTYVDLFTRTKIFDTLTRRNILNVLSHYYGYCVDVHIDGELFGEFWWYVKESGGCYTYEFYRHCGPIDLQNKSNTPFNVYSNTPIYSKVTQTYKTTKGDKHLFITSQEINQKFKIVMHEYYPELWSLIKLKYNS